jgi:eukaryotic-like serine/threonine-protein kinase
MSESALSQGSLIGGRYRLEHHLGEGGMGTVWSAVHTVTQRSVAMKFLRDSVRERAELRQRFLREASAASALKHPNAVEILDVFDFEESSPVMVMELLRGETLGSKLARDQRLSMEETAALLLPVISAVGTAHALGIVHRDLKPDNLFLAEAPDAAMVKVLDFGIAKLTAEYYLARGLSAHQTDAGAMLGTPYYMAPEQASGEVPVDHRADVWSLGVILYECLSGTRPIEGENLTQVVSRLMSAGIIPLERLAPELPRDVSAIVMQMLSRDPSRRPDGLREVSQVLARYSRASVPEFTEPSKVRGSLLPHPPIASQPPKARFVSSGTADPRGPTMISAPPVNSTVNTPPLAAAQQRKLPALVALGVALALGLIWAVFVRSPGSAATPRDSSATGSAGPSSPVVNAGMAAPASASAGQPNSAPAPSSSAAATGKANQSGVGALPKPKRVVATPRPGPVSKPMREEDSLFSGRK